MMVNERGIDLIASFEGFSPVPYDDPANNCTVGYGELLHLGPCTDADMTRPAMTEDEGKARLAQKVVPYAEAVLDQAAVELNENQIDALTSLCYNVGPGGIANVMRAVNTGGDVCAELAKIVHGTDGVVYPGLVRRRAAECELYNTPMEDDMDAPTKAEFAALYQLVLDQKAGIDYLIKIAQNLAARVTAIEAGK